MLLRLPDFPGLANTVESMLPIAPSGRHGRGRVSGDEAAASRDGARRLSQAPPPHQVAASAHDTADFDEIRRRDAPARCDRLKRFPSAGGRLGARYASSYRMPPRWPRAFSARLANDFVLSLAAGENAHEYRKLLLPLPPTAAGPMMLPRASIAASPILANRFRIAGQFYRIQDYARRRYLQIDTARRRRQAIAALPTGGEEERRR